MTPYETIKRKRDGGELTRRELQTFVESYLDGGVADYQMSAFLMAVYFRGMTTQETVWLTSVMLESGRTMDLSALGSPRIDKHSTGGVGDKLSLIVAPVAAACGVRVPMISGRGLGHTGGTLDKLESIPGLSTDFSEEAFERIVSDIGFAIVGQSESVAPADRRMYALRDVTATVECVPLIVASILSKKLAADLEGLVLDVKVGRGAFMPDTEKGRELARALIDTASSLGLPARALLTDMNAPVGRAVGNALEVAESLEVLRGGGPDDVRETSLALAAAMVHVGGLAESATQAHGLAAAALDEGRALERFRDFVNAQGGEARVVDDPGLLPRAAVTRAVASASNGFVRSVDALAVGRASVRLGAGRLRLGDPVDPAVGIVIAAPVGTKVEQGEPLAVIHAATDVAADEAVDVVLGAFDVGEEPPEKRATIIGDLGGPSQDDA
ncbi:MAG: thymidine phosphorylase [Candidatus Eisenbacteria bacterium]|nr:thymidine phosphorylase [Candidatus Eisenbacteria bacterium]